MSHTLFSFMVVIISDRQARVPSPGRATEAAGLLRPSCSSQNSEIEDSHRSAWGGSETWGFLLRGLVVDLWVDDAP
jgi:hypothetical protein